jgi:single-strand DNA-binding protein
MVCGGCAAAPPRRRRTLLKPWTFRVASNRSWRDRDGAQHEDTEWFRIVAWDKLGEICNQYLTKGTRVYVEGRIQTRKWTDRDGNDRYTTEIVAQDMIILSARGERGPVGEEPPAYSDQQYDEEAPAAEPAPRSPATARSNGGTRATGRGVRNQPQPIENDDDIPF